MSSQTILFIHGLFMTHRCWDGWVSYFGAKGYTCHAVPYPGRDKPPAELRKMHPDPQLSALTFDSVLAHYEKTAASLAEPPIIIGHSMGGLLTQALINRGLGAGGVAIASAPPRGIFSTRWSFLRSNWPLINPLNPASRPYLMPFADFQYTFVNGLPLAEQREAYDQQVVPESLRIPRGVLSSANGQIDFKKAHMPLLMLAGAADHIIPDSLVRANFKKYEASASITDFETFADRTHYGIAQAGWEKMADYVYEWIRRRGI
jgi:pimeloyl-ACP methyl ester carboxylesterase